MVKLQVHGAYIFGSPPPTIACPFCPRHLKSKGGRTRHIQAKHSGVLEPHALDLATNPSRTSSSPQPSFHGMNPVPSNFVSPPPSDLDDLSIVEPNAYLNINHHQFDQGSPGLGGDPNVRGQHVPDAPRLIHVYHPKLDGGVGFSFDIYILILT